jgi:hypothetical protein
VAQRQALLEPALQAAAQQALELGLTAAQAQQQFAHCLERALAAAEDPPENAP